jgi:hypothetical protein
MTTTKSSAISFGIGCLLTGLIMLYWHNTNPIKIIGETPTTTITTHAPVDFKACDDCVKSKGEIKESINEKDIMHITYEDDCKFAYKDVTLKAYSPNRHLLIFQIMNTSYSNKLINYGGDISYYYMLWNRFGIGGGIAFNLKSFSEHAGIVYSW